MRPYYTILWRVTLITRKLDGDHYTIQKGDKNIQGNINRSRFLKFYVILELYVERWTLAHFRPKFTSHSDRINLWVHCQVFEHRINRTLGECVNLNTRYFSTDGPNEVTLGSHSRLRLSVFRDTFLFVKIEKFLLWVIN